MASVTKGFKFESEGLGSYLRNLGGHKQLTREEEYSLGRRARKGDEEAKRILAVSNLPFVVAVARKFASRGALHTKSLRSGANASRTGTCSPRKRTSTVVSPNFSRVTTPSTLHTLHVECPALAVPG